MELLGKIKLIGDTKTYGDNGFRKRELVLTTEEQYPQHILIEFIQNNCELLDNYSIGQTVRIGINIRGREWESPDQGIKYFNSIQGWRIESLDDQVMDSPPEDLPLEDNSELKSDDLTEDDLPF
ncbi:MAG: DUF3127 domain-containing protein [Bacteroidota bacterium]|nr:DUF3127 domain-containing protein [Bacteroidota bacterium]MEC8611523.1 DUF3127 domain-containing protein [Bacteroidota bacterium]